MKSYSHWLGAALLVLAGAQQAQAQMIWNAEIERGLRFPGTPSFDGINYTQRYSQVMGAAPVYLNGDSRRLYYLDYLDRVDRAQKFGYPMPIDPFDLVQPVPPTTTVVQPAPIVQPAPVRTFFGGGLGLWRLRGG